MALLILALLQRSEERFSRNAETDLVCRLLLEKKKLADVKKELQDFRAAIAQHALEVIDLPIALRPYGLRNDSVDPDHQHLLFFFNDTATTEIYTLSLHDALPISEVDLVHQQTQNQRYGSSHIGATAKDISNVVTDAASGVVDIFHGIDKAVADTWNNFNHTRSSISDDRSEERFSRNAETDLVCRLLLEKKKQGQGPWDTW